MTPKQKILFNLGQVGLSLALTTPVLAAEQTIQVDAPTYAIKNIGSLLSGLVTASIVISAIMAFVFLVWGGVQWLTSGGDKVNTEKAQSRITAAIIGLAIVAASWALIQLVAGFFGLDFSQGINLKPIDTYK